MAMPNNSLSQVVVRYTWKGAPQNDPTDLVDYEIGGVALNNTTQGLNYQLWTFEAINDTIYVSALNTSGRIQLLQVGGVIQEITGTFDQNMNPFLAYSYADQWHYWWFDPIVGHMVISDLPTAVTSCKVCLDDRRSWEVINSDILLFYTRNGNLYHRRQRDRYTAELLLRESVGGNLVRVDMNGINRLQIKLQTDQP
jgi:hypothetical protein